MPTVEIPDGTQVEFPDSMSQDEIKDVIKRKFYTQPTTTTGTEPPFPNTVETPPRDPLERAARDYQLSPRTNPDAPLPSLGFLTAPLASIDLKPENIVEAARQFTASQLRVSPDVLTAKPTEETVKKAMKESPVAAASIGVAQGLEEMDSFFTSPVGIATLGIGALPAAAQRIVALGFAAQMMSQTPALARELGTEFGKPENQRDYTKIGKLVTQAAANTGFSVAGVLHGVKPKTPLEQAADNAQPVAPLTAAAVKEQAATLPTAPQKQIEPIALTKETESKTPMTYGEKYVEELGIDAARKRADYLESEANSGKRSPREMENLYDEAQNIRKAIAKREPISTKPEDLRPAVNIEGKIVVGEVGDTHADILERAGRDPESIPHPDPNRGFVLKDDPTKLINRTDAQTILGKEGTADAGGADSMDLPGAAEKKALKEAGVTEEELVGMGGAAQSEFSRPTIQDLIQPELREGLEKLPQQQASASTEPETRSFLKKSSDFFTSLKDSNVSEAFRGWLGTVAGKTFPKTTIADRQLGELGGRWVGSRAAAGPMADVFVNDVLAGLEVDPAKFDAALKADNLLSIRDGFMEEAHKLSQEAKEQGDPTKAEQAQGLADASQKVNTLLGSKNFPFKDETELQAYFQEPQVAEAVKRHKDNWAAAIEPLFRQTQDIDPNVELPTRGKYSEARINLNPVIEGEYKPEGRVVGGSSGTLTGTMRKFNPFARRAMGTGQSYVLNYADTIANSFHKQLEIANKRAFEDKLVDTGNAVITDAGARNVATPDGEPTKAYPLLRRPYQNKWIHVRRSLSGEYEIAANVILNPYRGTLLHGAATVFNKAALAGLTDATVHVENLGTTLFQVPGGSGTGLLSDALLSAALRLDVPVTMARAGIKGLPRIGNTRLWERYLRDKMPDIIVRSVNEALLKQKGQLAALAQINASRAPHQVSQVIGMRQLSAGVMKADQLTRLLLDDTYKNLVKEGVVTDTETNRREFVNQAGNYNLRSQGTWMRFLRQSAIAPFATAARNFATLGIRALSLNPGVQAASIKTAAALRANMLAKWIGSAALVAAANYIITGKILGRPGIRLGSIDTGENDKDGNPLGFDVLAFTGQSRAMRTLGVRSAAEAKLRGLKTTDATAAAARDISNVALSGVAGPIVREAMIMGTGYPAAVQVGRASRVAPPGESQIIENFKAAGWEFNPLLASIHEAEKPGGTIGKALERQAPRFTLQVGKQPDLINKYPQIVEGAQANAFIEDMIHVARTMPRSDRRAFIREQVKRLPMKYRDKASKEADNRHVYN